MHVLNNKPHIIAITETMPKNYRFEPQKAEMEINGYDLFLSEKGPGLRGCAIYTIKSLNASTITLSNDHLDNIWCEIKLLNNDKLLFGCVYRRPIQDDDYNKSFQKMIENYISNLSYTHLLIMGDFNLPKINWINWTTNSEDENDIHNTIIDTLQDHYLHQHVNRPTRARGDQRQNILDLVITNEEQMISDLEFWSPLGKGDHMLIKFTFNCYVKIKSSKQPRYYYNRGNYAEMKKELNIDWQTELTKLNTTEEKWMFFKNKVLSSIESHIPKSKPAKGTPGIINEAVLRAVRKKHRAWQRFMETKEGEKYREYCRARNKVKSLVRKTKLEFEKNISRNAKENPKQFWKYANSKTKVKDSIPDLDIPGTDDETGKFESTKTDKEKANVLSDFFSSVFTTENKQNIPPFEKLTDHILENLKTTQEMVLKKLKALKTNKSQGPDGIHPRVLQELSEELASPLSMIYNSSLETGDVPQDWRDATISAIFKKGNKRKPNNYRPVSLTSISCKILESIIRDHITDHMKSENLFSNLQYGFISGRSTTYQLLTALDKWTEIIDKNGNVDIVYFDFMKAFDTVPHARLLEKLKGYGINPELTTWIESFLSGRRQKVVVNGEHSDWSDVSSGIPQGSILGPLLFVIYINDLPSTVKSQMLLFADDTKIFEQITGEDDIRSLQQDIDGMNRWSEKWLLKFHPDKCKIMNIGSENQNQYQIGNSALEHIQEEKDLGVIIDSTLKFETHIDSKVRTANKIMGVIRRSFTYLDSTIFTRLFKALVRPHLEYANPVWHPTLKKTKTQIEKVQRRATKQLPCCTGLEYDERLRKLDLPCLLYRKLRGDMIEVYKMTQGKYDSNIKPPITLKDDMNLRQTRGNSMMLYKAKCNKSIRRNFFRNRVINFWNDLPEKVVQAPSVKAFENRLDKYWNKYRIKYDFENCLKFEASMLNPENGSV